ncbi:N-acetyl sugar amidotransferase [Candidatus Pelagibacter sp.]|nr:N-acetyl sugar amidotransferase [Candidatus Pelagibacter sp.]
MKLIWCKNCLLPNSRPNLVIEKNGNCSACNSFSSKRDASWEKKEQEFVALVKKIKSKNLRYDCIIPVSGGKDSTWQTIKCLEYGLNPLTVTWRSPQRTPIGQYNLDNLISLGVDHIDWTVNPKIEKVLTFESYKKFGAIAIPMHLAIFNIPMLIASHFKIPYIIWGENSAVEYGNLSKQDNQKVLNEKWYKNYGVTHNTKAKDWVSKNLPKNKMSSYFDYKSYGKEHYNPVSIFLGYFFKWDPHKTYEISKKFGFKAENSARTGYYKFADIDDNFISIHHWLKWYKFGFTRIFDNLSLEIRNKRISRKKAIEIIKSDGLKPPIDDIIKFCNYCNISKKKFFQIAEKFRNKNIWKKNKDKKLYIADFLIDEWKW